MFSLQYLTFGPGALALLGWFLWQSGTAAPHGFDEWLIFYAIALISWYPMSEWLKEGLRWIPAAEMFFFMHIQYYVSPFLTGDEEGATKVEVGTFLHSGLVILVFLGMCLYGYHASKAYFRTVQSDFSGILDREMNPQLSSQMAWSGLIGFLLWSVALQQGWLPDLSTYFNTVRGLFTAFGTLGLLILSYEMGRDRLDQRAQNSLVVIIVTLIIFRLVSGFLIDPIGILAIVFLGFFLGSRKPPFRMIALSIVVLAFLHIGKIDMRAEFWDEGSNYSSIARNPVEVLTFWLSASWERLGTGGDSEAAVPSLFKRGQLLDFVRLVIVETPSSREYLHGLTYWQATTIFVPRFLWPDKPRSTTPDETLAVYYGVQTLASTEFTSVVLGRIAEAWANFGWMGIIVVGILMGVILRIPTWLSDGFSPLSPRFLLAGPFIWFGINVESCFGSALHALCTALALTFVCLWFISAPAAKQSVLAAEQ